VVRVLIIAAVMACSSKSAPPAPTAGSAAPTPVTVAPGPDVHVDRRAELVAIVFRLAGADEYADPKGTRYLLDVDATFAPFAKHPAIVATRALVHDHHIGFEAPMELAIHLDDHLAVQGTLGERWQHVDVPAYAAQLRAFAADAKFDAFFAAHHDYITAVEERFRTALAKENPGPWFADFFGGTATHFVVIPGLVQGPNNYGAHDDHAMYQFMGLGFPPLDGLPTIDDGVIAIVVHEMAHSFINPVFDRHRAELVPIADPLFALVEPAMTAQHYGATQIMLNESGVRAITTLYIRDRKGDAAAAAATRNEVRNGFIWTAELAHVLATKKHVALDAYMPKIVEFFAAQAKRYEHGLPPMPFLGPIDAVFGGDIAVVHPADAAVTKYATSIRDHFFRTAKLELASDRTFDDLPRVGLVAYGSPTSNPIIANVLQRAQIALTATGLVLGSKHFDGAGVVLIACWPRGDDPSKGILVYAAASDADVVGINGLRAGSTDWVVGQRTAAGTFQPLASGDFPHAADGAWMLP